MRKEKPLDNVGASVERKDSAVEDPTERIAKWESREKDYGGMWQSTVRRKQAGFEAAIKQADPNSLEYLKLKGNLDIVAGRYKFAKFERSFEERNQKDRNYLLIRPMYEALKTKEAREKKGETPQDGNFKIFLETDPFRKAKEQGLIQSNVIDIGASGIKGEILKDILFQKVADLIAKIDGPEQAAKRFKDIQKNIEYAKEAVEILGTEELAEQGFNQRLLQPEDKKQRLDYAKKAEVVMSQISEKESVYKNLDKFQAELAADYEKELEKKSKSGLRKAGQLFDVQKNNEAVTLDEIVRSNRSADSEDSVKLNRELSKSTSLFNNLSQKFRVANKIILPLLFAGKLLGAVNAEAYTKASASDLTTLLASWKEQDKEYINGFHKITTIEGHNILIASETHPFFITEKTFETKQSVNMDYAERVTESSKLVISGINRAAELFGGKSAANIVFFPESATTAAYWDKTTTSVHFSGEFLNPKLASHLERVGLHEETHRQDYFAGLTRHNKNHHNDSAFTKYFDDKGGHFSDEISQARMDGKDTDALVQDISRNYFRVFSERVFFNDREAGGHAYDSPQELLASLISAISDSNFEEIITSKSTYDQMKFLKVIDVLKTTLEKKKMAGTPLYKLLNERAIFLKSLIHLT